MARSSPTDSFDYQAYLLTDEWKERRDEVLTWALHRCQVCNSGPPLHVHHRTYERVGDEDMSDLTVLCQECHERFHKMITCPICGANIATVRKGQD